ncbi:MAG: glycosyltransferase [Sphingomonadaceae bacterium]
MAAPVRILHCHSTFTLGGKEARAVRLMNAFGDRARHAVLSAVPGAFSAREAIDPEVAAAFPEDAPPLAGRPGLGRLYRLARYMRGFDLVLTYNWGAFDAVMARYLFRGAPLVHHEDGFNADEAGELKPLRNLYRRLGLSAAHRLVVPSRRLEEIARRVWGQPSGRIARIANGIDVARFAHPPDPDAIPGFARRAGEVVIGTVAGLRRVKDLPALVRAVAPIADARLVIVGDGPEREAIRAEARRRGMTERVHLPGFLPRPERYIGLFDIFALSSRSEQFPISLIEAMAAGLPVAAPAVGDVAAMVSAPNRALIVPAGDEQALGAVLARLAGDPALRVQAGRANAEKARERFGEERMIAAYARLYGEAIGAPRAFRA